MKDNNPHEYKTFLKRQSFDEWCEACSGPFIGVSIVAIIFTILGSMVGFGALCVHYVAAGVFLFIMGCGARGV